LLFSQKSFFVQLQKQEFNFKKVLSSS